MSEVFSIVQGEYGKIVVLEVRHDLVPHVHSEIQFGFWLGGGKCQGVVNDEHVLYSETQAVAINRYQSHDLVIGKDSEPVMMLMLYINEEWFDERFIGKSGPYTFQSSQITCTSEMRFQCWKLMQKTLLISEVNKISIEDDLIDLLNICIAASSTTTREVRPFIRRKLIDFRLRAAIKHIQENMTATDLMKTLAKTVGVSRSRLYELFKKDLNSSPKLIQNSMLLEMAINKMAQKDSEISTISRSLGFSSAANFSRFFRSHKGITPTAYQRKKSSSSLHETSQI